MNYFFMARDLCMKNKMKFLFMVSKNALFFTFATTTTFSLYQMDTAVLCLCLLIVLTLGSDDGRREEEAALQEKLHHLEQQHNSSSSHHQSVHQLLRQRLPAGCSYSLIPGHPTLLQATSASVVIHLLNGKGWLRNGAHPDCAQPTHSIFLNALQPEHCASVLDFEWVECGGYAGIRPHAWKGQHYVFLCRESPKERKRLLPHWIDGGSGLCAIFPTNWTPPPLYLTEVQPVPLEAKRQHPLVTSAISHSYSSLRANVTAALIRRNIPFHRFGSQQRTISMSDYLKSFNSKPLLQATALETQKGRLEKENAIRWSKFHLALEHTSQHGYMSEKVWQALRVGTVPIYYGAPEAGFFLPPHSTLFLSDFASYDKLIDYLLYLDKNDTAYMSYLEWRQILLTQPQHPYTRFLRSYGQGEMFRDHLCAIDERGSSVLAQLKRGEQPEPFLSAWTHWVSGQQCVIPPGGCAQRADFRDPPTHFSCS